MLLTALSTSWALISFTISNDGMASGVGLIEKRMDAEQAGCEMKWIYCTWVWSGGYVMFGCGKAVMLWVDADQTGSGIWWMNCARFPHGNNSRNIIIILSSLCHHHSPLTQSWGKNQ